MSVDSGKCEIAPAWCAVGPGIWSLVARVMLLQYESRLDYELRKRGKKTLLLICTNKDWNCHLINVAMALTNCLQALDLSWCSQVVPSDGQERDDQDNGRYCNPRIGWYCCCYYCNAPQQKLYYIDTEFELSGRNHAAWWLRCYQ